MIKLFSLRERNTSVGTVALLDVTGTGFLFAMRYLPSHYRRTETDPVLMLFRIADNEQSPKSFGIYVPVY
jgi:hypothetical protein